MNKKILTKFVFTGIVVVFVLSMLAIACAQQQPGVTSPTSGSKYGGILYRCQDIDSRNLGDPATPPFRMSEQRYAYAAIETLLRCDDKGTPTPWLATGWKVANDLKSITFTLQKGIKFHDGTLFNAEAVKWNLDRYKNSSNPELKSISSIDVIDDYTVRLNLPSWDSMLIDNLFYSPGMMISPTAFQKAGATDKERADWALKNPVGTGPFKFVSWERDVRIKYTKFDEYWQKGKPYLDGMEWVIIAEPLTRLAALKRGEVDHVAGVDFKDAKEMEKEKLYILNRAPLSGQAWSLAGDSKNSDSPFSNVKVRQAVEYACDKKAIVDALTFGYGTVNNQYAMPGNWAYNNDVKGYPYDPNKAKQLLAEAGYANGFSTKLLVQNFSYYPGAAPIVQEYLRKIGITAEIELLSSGSATQLFTKGWKNGLAGLSSTLILPDTTRNLYTDISPVAVQGSSSILFPDDYVEALNKAKAATDTETKTKWTKEAMKLLIDKYACISIFYTQSKVGFANPRIHDHGINAIQEIIWTPENAWKEIK